ncbi:hypothetical protein Plhal304r1_c003g0011911 [Plasmopara halstedii]
MSKTRYPFVFSAYLRNIHRKLLGSSFVLLASSTCAYPCDPNTRRCPSSGFCWKLNSNGVMSGFAVFVERLMRYTAVLTPSAHHSEDMLL